MGHHDILVTAFEFHGDCKRVSHEALVQPVKPVLVPENKVGAKFQAPRDGWPVLHHFNQVPCVISARQKSLDLPDLGADLKHRSEHHDRMQE